VILDAVIDVNGKIAKLTMTRGLGFGIDEAVLATVQAVDLQTSHTKRYTRRQRTGTTLPLRTRLVSTANSPQLRGAPFIAALCDEWDIRAKPGVPGELCSLGWECANRSPSAPTTTSSFRPKREGGVPGELARWVLAKWRNLQLSMITLGTPYKEYINLLHSLQCSRSY